jgi:malate dehydrogenase
VPSVVILGAGPVGAAVAHRLAERARVRAITLVDASLSGASGKALDIRQSGPVSHFDTCLTAAGDVLAAAGASTVVVADEIDAGEWEGERGLVMLGQLIRAGVTAPMVFTGSRALWLMEKCYGELKVPAHRLIGTAASAMVGVARGWAGLELGLSAVDVSVVGRPPGLIVGWSTGTAHGALLTDRIPAHRLRVLSEQLITLWPPGPFAVASATAPVVEALIFGSRQLHSAMTVVDGDLGVRGRAILLPLALAHGRVQSHVLPSLSPQERTDLLNSVAR